MAEPMADAAVGADAPSMPEPPAPEWPDLVAASTVLENLSDTPGVVEVELTASLAERELVDGITLPMMAYNGQFPGPLLLATVGDEVIVHFQNDLDEPTTIHWHGLRVPDEMDGSPRVQDPVEPGESFTYRFVVPDAGTYWYHPHVRANEQLEKGLYGPIVIREAEPIPYDLERMIVLDDILIDPETRSFPPFLTSHPELMHGRYGNILLTNGQESETVTASAEQGTVERWRIVNTANARTMRLTIEGATWRIIGTDGGLLPAPIETTSIQLPVGQRYDVEVRYQNASEVQLLSHVQTRGGLEPWPVFVVNVAASDRPLTTVPFPEGITLPSREPGQTVQIDLSATNDSVRGLQWTINGQVHGTEPLFTFTEGETVRMRIVNQAGPEHPFHLHGQFFQIVPNGDFWADQPGLRDTVLVPGLETVEIIAYLDNPGHWMAHCHILEHAARGMMSEIYVNEAN